MHLLDTPAFGVCGPAILKYGSEDLKYRYLRRLLRGDDSWCVIRDEPGERSDHPKCRVTAVCWDDGTWRISGQVTCTPERLHADYALLTAQINPPSLQRTKLAHFVVPMKAQGPKIVGLGDMTSVVVTAENNCC